MQAMLEHKTVMIDGEAFEMWAPLVPDFSCLPDDLRDYMTTGRWDLVFNALCYLADAVPEGHA